MENMDKELTVPKWVVIIWPKIPQMHKNESAQIVCPSIKVWDYDEKRLHWAPIVRDIYYLDGHFTLKWNSSIVTYTKIHLLLSKYLPFEVTNNKEIETKITTLGHVCH